MCRILREFITGMIGLLYLINNSVLRVIVNTCRSIWLLLLCRLSVRPSVSVCDEVYCV